MNPTKAILNSILIGVYCLVQVFLGLFTLVGLATHRYPENYVHTLGEILWAIKNSIGMHSVSFLLTGLEFFISKKVFYVMLVFSIISAITLTIAFLR